MARIGASLEGADLRSEPKSVLRTADKALGLQAL